MIIHVQLGETIKLVMYDTGGEPLVGGEAIIESSSVSFKIREKDPTANVQIKFFRWYRGESAERILANEENDE